ncbi:MAG: protein kinase [Acidobacteriota bacterium]
MSGDLAGKTVGRFEVRSRLGAGGMGEVYEARDTTLRRTVALKRLSPELSSDAKSRRRLLTEARSAARLNHQCIAALYDVAEVGDELLLVMEYVEGETLRQRLQGPVSIEDFVGIAVQCAEALAAAHARHIVHGDIKPENIMLMTGGQVKILDFGVAHLISSAEEDSGAMTLLTTQIGTGGGTVPYMAPEVLLRQEGDHRADLFSLGVVFYEMLTGHHPFLAGTQAAVVDRILHEAPVPAIQLNPGVPAQAATIVAKMLAKNPAQRSATTEDLVVDLQNLRTQVTMPEPHPAPLVPPRPRRRWGIVAGGAVALLALAAIAVPPVRQLLTGKAAPGRPPRAATTAPFDPSDWIIAVLPSRTAQAEDPDIAVLNEGLATTLTAKLTKLSRAHDLQIIPTSILREQQIDSLKAARQELGVTLALNFDTHLLGNSIRINCNLVDLRLGRQLAAETVDGSLDDLIALEEQVAVHALRMLRLELQPMEQGLLAVGTDEPRAYAYFVRGRGYLQNYRDADSVDAAVTLFQQALRVDSGYARAHGGLGEAFWWTYQLTSDPQWVSRAAAECAAAVQLDEFDANGRICLGTVYQGTGRYAEAVEEFEEATRLEPTNDDAYRGLAAAYETEGKLDLAEETYKEAIALRPHYWAGYRYLGAFYYGQGRYAEMLDSFEEAVQLAPDSYHDFSNLGVAYYYLSRWVDARRAFERALEIKPNYTWAISNLGTLYFFEQRFADSARMFEKAVEANDREYWTWGNLGDAYFWAPGEREQAPAAYRRALSLAEEQLLVNPNDSEVVGSMAIYFAMLGERQPALEHLGRALELAPESVDALHRAAQVHQQLGDSERALDYLARALDGGYPVKEVRADPIFTDLWDDERYQKVVGS